MKLFVILLLFTVIPVSAKVYETGISYYEYNEEVEGRIGIQVDYTSGKVGKVYKQSPAYQKGIRVGDKIILVDGKENNSHSIHGTPGTVVNLKIKTKNGEIREVSVVRIERYKIK